MILRFMRLIVLVEKSRISLVVDKNGLPKMRGCIKSLTISITMRSVEMLQSLTLSGKSSRVLRGLG